jgi:phage terminase large subunit-like protein
MPADDLQRFFLSDKYNWPLWARPEQLPPAGPWSTWMLLTGRGGGKTRPMAQLVLDWSQDSPAIALMAKDDAMVRDVMIEGESGILASAPPWFRSRIQYDRSKIRLTFPSGAQAYKLTAEAGADAARGRQFYKAWAEEVVAWPHADEAWNEGLMNALRLGPMPQVGVTTTPKRGRKLVVNLALGPRQPSGQRLASLDEVNRNRGTADDRYHSWFRWSYDVVAQDGSVRRVVVARWSSERNAVNLSPGFVEARRQAYGDSRYAAEELDAELLEKIEGALWSEELIDRYRVEMVPAMSSVIVAVDPTRSDAPVDEAGIIVGGLGADMHAYILADESMRGSPDAWLTRALDACNRYSATALVYEKNRMGSSVRDMVKSRGSRVRLVEVQASDGKRTRAEPVSALYEQGRVHHAGIFRLLEDEMVGFDPKERISPNRMDALVWCVTNLLLGEQRRPLVVR